MSPTTSTWCHCAFSLTLNISNTSWSNLASKDSFKISLSYGFQNWLLDLIKIQLRYGGLKRVGFHFKIVLFFSSVSVQHNIFYWVNRLSEVSIQRSWALIPFLAILKLECNWLIMKVNWQRKLINNEIWLMKKIDWWRKWIDEESWLL